MYTYTYNIQNDFPNHKADAGALHSEIKDSSISSELDGVTVLVLTCEVSFFEELSSGDKTTLDSLVAAHQGEALPRPEYSGILVYRQNPEPTLPVDNKVAIWVDTDNASATYLIFRRGNNDQVKVQLA